MKTALALVLLLGALTGCGADEETKVVPGRVSDDVEGQAITVRLPVGELNVTVGKPLTASIDRDLAADNDEHQVPSDGSFIPIAWDFDALAEIPGRAFYGQEPLPAKAALRIGDQVIDLPEPYVVRGIGIGTAPVQVFYVPSKDADPELSLEVTYDGLTQLADVAAGEVAPSVASSLYADAVQTPEKPCDPVKSTRYPRLRVDATCVTSTERVPYLPGSGWAPDGESYPVVGYRITLRDADLGDLDWEPESVVGTSTVDNATSIKTVSTSADQEFLSPIVHAIEVFPARAPGGEAKVSGTFTIERADPGEGAREPNEIAVSATIPLP